jgi:uroporphyrinogen decarboxylase
MTSRERVLLTLDHQIPDRLPVDLLWPRRETVKQLQEYFQTDSKEAVLRKLDVDLRWFGIGERYPNYEGKVNGILGGVAPGAGRGYIFRDAQTFEDEWGVVQRVGDDGKYLQWKSGPLVGKENLTDWALPAVEYPSVEVIRETLRPYRDFMTITEVAFPFKIAWHLSGYEHFMMWMAVTPEVVEELYDQLYAFQTNRAVICATAGFDVIAIVGDIASQNGMMFSPQMFEYFDTPRLTKLVQAVKLANPSTKVFYHSDGKMQAVIPHLIRCGVDILNPIQSACMDPAEIKRTYGEQLSFHGAISVQHTLPYGSVEDVRREVIERIETVGYDGGFIVSPENSIPYDVPLENVLALYDTVRGYDYRRLANGGSSAGGCDARHPGNI